MLPALTLYPSAYYNRVAGQRTLRPGVHAAVTTARYALARICAVVLTVLALFMLCVRFIIAPCRSNRVLQSPVRSLSERTGSRRTLKGRFTLGRGRGRGGGGRSSGNAWLSARPHKTPVKEAGLG